MPLTAPKMICIHLGLVLRKMCLLKALSPQSGARSSLKQPLNPIRDYPSLRFRQSNQDPRNKRNIIGLQPSLFWLCVLGFVFLFSLINPFRLHSFAANKLENLFHYGYTLWFVCIPHIGLPHPTFDLSWNFQDTFVNWK